MDKKIRALLRSKFFLILISLLISCLVKTLADFDLEASDAAFRPGPVPEFLRDTDFGKFEEQIFFYRP